MDIAGTAKRLTTQRLLCIRGIVREGFASAAVTGRNLLRGPTRAKTVGDSK